MRRIVLTFGLISGIMLSVMMLLTIPFMDRIGFEKGMMIGYTTMVASFIMVYFGVRSYRDGVAGGTITFSKALQVGGLIMLIGCACYVATWQLIYHRITPDFMDKYAAWSIEQARQSGAADSTLARQVRQVEEMKRMYADPLVNIGVTFLEPLPVGLLFALVSAGALSRRRKRGEGGSA
jgi:Protein of unknown function (DUF4199)